MLAYIAITLRVTLRVTLPVALRVTFIETFTIPLLQWLAGEMICSKKFQALSSLFCSLMVWQQGMNEEMGVMLRAIEA